MASRKLVHIFLLTIIFYTIKGEKLDDMSWQPGDIIKCKLSGAAGFFGFKHYMIGGDKPNHVISVFNDGANGVISDIHHIYFTSGINRDKCENYGKGSLSREETIKKAQRMVGTTFTYDLSLCNCQHFTNYWANGSSGKWYNNQSLRSSADYCPV
ncbi:uncharacterized protein LOC123674234 [Harmonia axyridis]|uniref:uncharacterized protein LOC123674234 n=1 Tax=Harmonia axyridis TaxID=115357 RepID=UPI001E274F13|nr:uncharacterized protein LOC123674234 [Harmonia axyridis]